MVPRLCFRRRFLTGPPVLPKNFRQIIPNKEKDEIIVAMSSGVDSLVCAALFASQNYKVRGIYMANWSDTKECVEADWKDVQRVCKAINIPCERINFEKEYWIDVFEPMIEMYKKGLTPNPDVGCNKYIKFGKMIEHLNKKMENIENNWFLVTGHYARILQNETTKEFNLLRGVHPQKDQSYYLLTIPKEILPKILLPLGHATKPEVRNIAKQLQLPTCEKPDSQGLCFVSQKGNFRDFLNQYIRPIPGDIVTKDKGVIVGQHQGLWHGTIGQRPSISLPQGDPKYKGVWFISEKNIEKNQLIIVKGSNNKDLFKDIVSLSDWCWLVNDSTILEKFKKITCQFRSLQEEIEVSKIIYDENNMVTRVHLATPGRAVAPGQTLVLYGDTEVLLGSGVIHTSF